MKSNRPQDLSKNDKIAILTLEVLNPLQKIPAKIDHQEEDWDMEITPQNSLLNFNFKEIWRYRDLLLLFVKRDFIAGYKQTILGPIWFFIQPIFTSIMFTVIFGRLAGISTDGIPPMLFYMAGVTNWNYFSECLLATSTTFTSNQGIFGKVYFPRLVVPLSIVVSALMKYGIQLILFLGFYGYFFFQPDSAIQPNAYIFLFPILLIILAGLGLGFGLIITSLTTKYRDLVFLLKFGVSLLMYATPVIYPLSVVPEKYQLLAVLNPMTSVIETFKYSFLGQGTFNWFYLGYSFIFMLILLLFGVAVFNKTEKNFMDTV